MRSQQPSRASNSGSAGLRPRGLLRNAGGSAEGGSASPFPIAPSPFLHAALRRSAFPSALSAATGSARSGREAGPRRPMSAGSAALTERAVARALP